MKMTTQNYLVPILLPDYKQPKKIKGESALCVEIAWFLKEQSIKGDFPYVWFHVPNQFLGKYNGLGGAILTFMGRICGIPDYAFLGKDGCFFIEVKTDIGKLSDNQKIVQKWCEQKGVPYYLCRSLEDVKNVLKEKSDENKMDDRNP